MKHPLLLTILLLLIASNGDAALFIKCEADDSDCCCSEEIATDCYCAPACDGDTFGIVGNFTSFLKWPAAAADNASELVLTATVKDGVCENANGAGWESINRTTTTLKRDCSIDGSLSSIIYYTDSNGNNVKIDDSMALVGCTPSQKSITVTKAEAAHGFTDGSLAAEDKIPNKDDIDNRTALFTSYGSTLSDRSGGLALGVIEIMGDNQYTFDNDQCNEYYVPYVFELATPDILETFEVTSVAGAADVVSIVSNNSLIKTYGGGDTTTYGRVFQAYGDSTTKVVYCQDSSISDIYTCNSATITKNNHCNNSPWSTTYSSGSGPSFLPSLKSGTNYLYLIYAIKGGGGGAFSFSYKFKDDVSVHFLENY